MITRRNANAGLIGAAMLAATSGLAAANAAVRELPPPRIKGGKPVASESSDSRVSMM